MTPEKERLIKKAQEAKARKMNNPPLSKTKSKEQLEKELAEGKAKITQIFFSFGQSFLFKEVKKAFN